MSAEGREQSPCLYGRDPKDCPACQQAKALHEEPGREQAREHTEHAVQEPPTCACGHVVYDHAGWLYDCSRCACTGPGLPGMIDAPAREQTSHSHLAGPAASGS